MIVIIALNETEFLLNVGDKMQVTCSETTKYTTVKGDKVILTEDVVGKQTINYTAFYRFTLEDGSFKNPHTSVFIGNKNKLPLEIQQAKKYSELTTEQQINFKKSLGIDTYEAV